MSTVTQIYLPVLNNRMKKKATVSSKLFLTIAEPERDLAAKISRANQRCRATQKPLPFEGRPTGSKPALLIGF
jgi:hypothetical protein